MRTGCASHTCPGLELTMCTPRLGTFQSTVCPQSSSQSLECATVCTRKERAECSAFSDIPYSLPTQAHMLPHPSKDTQTHSHACAPLTLYSPLSSLSCTFINPVCSLPFSSWIWMSAATKRGQALAFCVLPYHGEGASPLTIHGLRLHDLNVRFLFHHFYIKCSFEANCPFRSEVLFYATLTCTNSNSTAFRGRLQAAAVLLLRNFKY